MVINLGKERSRQFDFGVAIYFNLRSTCRRRRLLPFCGLFLTLIIFDINRDSSCYLPVANLPALLMSMAQAPDPYSI